MERHCHKEIVELHQFFQQWFNGELAPSDNHFKRVSQVLGNNFTIITPDGTLVERLPLLNGLRAAHGAHHNMRIWIKNVRVHREEGNILLATYEEWQQEAEVLTVRLSSVVFCKKTGNPHNLVWLHVHETWLPKNGHSKG
jgi:hypothetical protein